MDDFITKPVLPRDVQRILEKFSPLREVVPDGMAEPSSQGAHPTFDLDALRERLYGDQELMVKILELFVEDVAKELLALPDLVARGRTQEIRALAHRINGASSNVGAIRLSRAAQELELNGGWLSPTNLERMGNRLCQEFEEFQTRIQMDVIDTRRPGA